MLASGELLLWWADICLPIGQQNAEAEPGAHAGRGNGDANVSQPVQHCLEEDPKLRHNSELTKL